jgi:hypothetical protein
LVAKKRKGKNQAVYWPDMAVGCLFLLLPAIVLGLVLVAIGLVVVGINFDRLTIHEIRTFWTSSVERIGIAEVLLVATLVPIIAFWQLWLSLGFMRSKKQALRFVLFTSMCSVAFRNGIVFFEAIPMFYTACRLTGLLGPEPQ